MALGTAQETVPQQQAAPREPLVNVHIGPMPSTKSAEVGFGHAVVRGIQAGIEQRKANRARETAETREVVARQSEFRALGIESLQGLMGGSDIVPRPINAPGHPEHGRLETTAEAKQRAARDEFDDLRTKMFGPAPTPEQLNDPKMGPAFRRELGQQNRQVYRLIRETQKEHAQRASGADVILRDATTGRVDVYASPATLEQFRQWLTPRMEQARNVPGSLVAVLSAVREGVQRSGEQPENVDALRGKVQAGLGLLGRVTTDTALGAAIGMGKAAERVTGPVVDAIASALNGAPESIIAAREFITRMTERLKIVDVVMGQDAVIQMLEARLGIPGIITTFMHATEAIEGEYYRTHPEAQVVQMESRASGWRARERARRVVAARARHEWAVVIGRGIWRQTGERVFNREARQKRMAERQQARIDERNAALAETYSGSVPVTPGQGFRTETPADVYARSLIAEPGMKDVLLATDTAASRVDALLAEASPANQAAAQAEADRQSARDLEVQMQTRAQMEQFVTRYMTPGIPDDLRSQIRDIVVNSYSSANIPGGADVMFDALVAERQAQAAQQAAAAAPVSPTAVPPTSIPTPTP